MNMVRGWCPTAWTPMAAGDGLLLRVRPRLGRLSPAQAATVAAVAQAHGNGAIDLTNRAALQLRGLDEAGWRAALERLIDAGLVDPDPVREGRALMVAPDWRSGDDSHRIATTLLDRLDELPPLPGKVGLVIDAGPTAVLTRAPGDFRVERSATGGLILRADGRPGGAPLTPGDEADALIRLARWFVDSGGTAAGRMARHHAPLPDWAQGDVASAVAAAPNPGAHPLGQAIGLPFGRIDAAVLLEFADAPDVHGLRVTPWRLLIVEGAAPALPAADPALLTVDACVGAPACPQGTVETRAIARRLAPLITGRLHVSGCAKGCARSAPADVVVTGRDGRYDLGYAARAGDPPARAGLSPRHLIACLERPDAV